MKPPPPKHYEEPWVRTRDRRRFYPTQPDASVINIEVLSHVLDRIPRFNGHTVRRYSVLDHSIHVAWLLRQQGHEHLIVPGLLHDAHEAYSGYGDVSSPVKALTNTISVVERRIDVAVGKSFEIDPKLFKAAEVKEADMAVYAGETRDTMPLPYDFAPEHEDHRRPENLPDPPDWKVTRVWFGRQRFLMLFKKYHF